MKDPKRRLPWSVLVVTVILYGAGTGAVLWAAWAIWQAVQVLE